MAKTLLNGVNEVLKNVGIIRGDSAALTSLTDSARQDWIDTAISQLNNALEAIYDAADITLPKVEAETTITLIENDRDYALPDDDDFEEIIWPLHDRTNGRFIVEYKGGYDQLIIDQLIPTNFTGRPQAAAIRTTDGQLYLDRLPSADVAGEVFTLRYRQDISLSVAADTFPCRDVVFRALVLAASELWKKINKKDFDEGLLAAGIGRAARKLNPNRRKEADTVNRVGQTFNTTDPFNNNGE